MNNFEKIKTFNFAQIAVLMQQKCLMCKYHYMCEECYTKCCTDGMRQWLSQPVSKQEWQEILEFVDMAVGSFRYYYRR